MKMSYIKFLHRQSSVSYTHLYVDADDAGHGSYERKKKDSFYWYKQCIESNGENLDQEGTDGITWFT